MRTITVYHVTNTKNITKIKRCSLIPKAGPRAVQLGYTYPAVFVFDSLGYADRAINTWLGRMFKGGTRLAALPIHLPLSRQLNLAAMPCVHQKAEMLPIKPEWIDFEHMQISEIANAYI